MADSDEGLGSASDAPDDRRGKRPSPAQTNRTKIEKTERQERLAAAMRENLLKRKRQQRARNSGENNHK